VNQELIKKVMDLFEKSKISKLSIDSEELKISLRKNNTPPIPIKPQIIAPAKTVDIIKPIVDTSTTIKADSVGFFDPMITQKDIKASMMIPKGTAIYSITSMNIAHDKKLERDCKIVEFLVTKGTPVEYGQPVARINEL